MIWSRIKIYLFIRVFRREIVKDHSLVLVKYVFVIKEETRKEYIYWNQPKRKETIILLCTVKYIITLDTYLEILNIN